MLDLAGFSLPQLLDECYRLYVFFFRTENFDKIALF